MKIGKTIEKRHNNMQIYYPKQQKHTHMANKQTNKQE